MLSTDSTILEILNEAKIDGNKLLSKFKIGYPDKKLAQENNCILVAAVSSENQLSGFEFEQFRDLVEILVVTKHKDNRKAIEIIKTVSYEICRLILLNKDRFPNKPVIRNVNPYFDVDMILSRGQIMVNVNTEPVDFEISEDTVDHVCSLISDNIEIE